MIHDQIDEYLGLVARDNAYRVVRVLKESAYERTEVVAFEGVGGAEQGPFVRKRIARDSGTGSAYQELFAAQREGRRFKHLPRIHDCYELGTDLVVVMEHVQGATLHEVVYERDPSPELAAEVFPLLCDAVLELHEGLARPIIHRDLKPTNAILSEANLTLIDFGIARAWRDGADADTNAFGTRAYAPPEQFGYGQTDVRSDVYALGMMLYYLLTEQVPHPGLAGASFDEATIPARLRPVLAKATAFDPAARYGSVRELRAAFEEAATAMGSAAKPLAQQMPSSGDSATIQPGRASEAAVAASAPLAVELPEPQGSPVALEMPPGASAPVARASASTGDDLRRAAHWLWLASEWAGLVWDVLLLVFAAATIVVGFGDIIHPNPDAAALPLWLRAWEYCGVLVLMLGIMWMLVDWRLVRKHVRAFEAFRWSRWLIAGAIIVAVGFAVALSGSAFAAAFFPKG